MQYHIINLCITMVEQELMDLRARKILSGRRISTLEEAHRILMKLRGFY